MPMEETMPYSYVHETCTTVGIDSQPIMAYQLSCLKYLLCHQSDVYWQMVKANNVLCSYNTTE